MCTWLKSRLGYSVDEERPLANDAMLAFFLSTIEVRAKQIGASVASDAVKKAIFDEINKSLGSFDDRFISKPASSGLKESAWNEAYRLERLMVLIEPTENLISEIRRRLDEAADEKVPAAARLHIKFEATAPITIDTSATPPAIRPGGETVLRSLLLDILEETQWFLQRRFHAWPSKKRATKRTTFVGLCAFSVLLFPYLVIYWGMYPNQKLSFETLSWLPLYTSLTSGLFGALFSRLIFLQTNWNILTLNEINDAKDWTSILLRGCVGMTGSVMLFFFLQAGVLQGGAFPNFDEIGLRHSHFSDIVDTTAKEDPVAFRLLFPSRALALLIVWSFLAGFSERLVPSILQSTERSIEGGTPDKK